MKARRGGQRCNFTQSSSGHLMYIVVNFTSRPLDPWKRTAVPNQSEAGRVPGKVRILRRSEKSVANAGIQRNIFCVYFCIEGLHNYTGKVQPVFGEGKANPVQDWRVPEGFRRLRLTDFVAIGM